jgi:hypothetical protein
MQNKLGTAAALPGIPPTLLTHVQMGCEFANNQPFLKKIVLAELFVSLHSMFKNI